MAETSTPTVTVDERVEIGVSALGVVAVAAAAYYTGTTGSWEPLMAASLGLGLVVLLVNSE